MMRFSKLCLCNRTLATVLHQSQLAFVGIGDAAALDAAAFELIVKRLEDVKDLYCVSGDGVLPLADDFFYPILVALAARSTLKSLIYNGFFMPTATMAALRERKLSALTMQADFDKATAELLATWLASPTCSLREFRLESYLQRDEVFQCVWEALGQNFSVATCYIIGVPEAEVEEMLAKNASKGKLLKSRCSSAAVAILGCKKRRIPLFQWAPQQIVALIAQMVFASKFDDVWLQVDRPKRNTRNSASSHWAVRLP